MTQIVARTEKSAEVSEFAPDDIHLPGIFVRHLTDRTPEQAAGTKWIKKTIAATDAPSQVVDELK